MGKRNREGNISAADLKNIHKMAESFSFTSLLGCQFMEPNGQVLFKQDLGWVSAPVLLEGKNAGALCTGPVMIMELEVMAHSLQGLPSQNRKVWYYPKHVTGSSLH